MPKHSLAKRAWIYTRAAEMYLAGSSIHEITKVMGVTHKVLNPALKEMEIWRLPENTPTPENILEFKEKILAAYNTGERSPSKIAALIESNAKRVNKYMNLLNLDYPHDSGGSARKHMECFNLIPKEHLAYICGLIATDGNLHKKTTAVRLNLQINDINTVKFVAQALTNPPGVVKIVPAKGIGTKSQARYDQCLPQFKGYLESLGITPNKSLNLDIDFTSFSDVEKWYFLRGALDGDGSIYCKHKSERLCDYEIYICSSSKRFLEGLKSIFGGSLRESKRGGDSLGNNSNYRLLYYGAKARLLATHLPVDDFTMERKTQRIRSLLNTNYKGAVLKGSVWTNYNNNYKEEV